MRLSTHARRICARPIVFALLALLLTTLLGLGYRDLRQATLDQTLFVAVRAQDVDSARELLDQGANPNTPFDVAAPISLNDWVAFLRKRLLPGGRGGAAGPPKPRPEFAPLFVATAYGNVELVRLLLDRGANVNAADSSGRPGMPLRVAAFDLGGNETLVRVLLDHGARINATDQNGQTALARAVLLGNAPVVRLLLAHGADPNVADAEGRTPLMRAASYYVQQVKLARYTEIAGLLAQHGADVNRRDNQGRTALAFAADGRRPAIVALLKQRGATR